MKNPILLSEVLTRRLKAWGARFNFRFKGAILLVLKVISVLSFLAAVSVVTCMIIYVGFDHTLAERHELNGLLAITRWIFLADVVTRFLLDQHNWLHVNRPFKRLIDILLLLTFLPQLIHGHPLIDMLGNRWFVGVILLIYSILEISRSMMYIIGRRVNPALLLSGSFLIIIFIGTFLLMLPRCTYGGIGFVDSLFISTSAVCITGLTPVDISAIFTPLGLFVLALLIQIGGLGLLTFTSVFALSFTGNSSIYSQLMMKDMVYSRSWSSLPSTLLYILGFTLVIEGFGALALFGCIHGRLGMTFSQEVFTAIFTSLSGFCNAGFSNIPGGLSNGSLLWSGPSLYWIMTVLIIAGSIGFPLLVNFKDTLFSKISQWWRRLRHRQNVLPTVHLIDMNSKIVITTFGWLFVIGAIIFGVLEWNNTLSQMSLPDKIAQAAFNSAVPRSAGFSSVPVSGMKNVTVIVLMLLMWIGGASQSTGGGIKVNTFAAIILNLRAIVTGGGPTRAFGRQISVGSIRRAHAVVTLSIFGYFIYSALLLAFEPALPVKDLLFESASALFTVGSSMGVTPSLSDKSLILLSTAMLLGRVGILSLLTGVGIHRSETGVTLPTGNLIIN